MSQKVLIIGRHGQLGSELCRQMGDHALGLTRAELDITSAADVGRVLRAYHPTAVVNATAYTRVDRAEDDAAECRLINATAVGHLAEACARLDCPLVHVSTDYVFGAAGMRDRPYRETDSPGPQSVYAQTKLEGEIMAALAPRHFILRSCGLYGRRPVATHGGKAANFVDTMLRLAGERDEVRVVNDQHCTPTSASDLARAIVFLIQNETGADEGAGGKFDRGAAYGLFHVTNAGATTWRDFAAEIFRLRGLQTRLTAITTAEYGAKAPRPAYSVLDCSKYEALGGPPMTSWQEALARYLATVS